MNKRKYIGENELPGKFESLWIDTTPDTHFPSLGKNMSVDVVILGGGIAGITAALLLKEEGLKVAVIEMNRICKGVTGYTTAKITSQHGLIYKYLADKFGLENAKIYAQANQSAVEKIANLIKVKKIQCDFYRKSAYVFSQNSEEDETIKKELEIVKKCGIPAFYTEDVPLPFKVKSAIGVANQAQFHPRKYVLALADLIQGSGSYIFENTQAVDIKEGEPCEVITDKGVVKAKDVIIATNFPFYNKYLFSPKISPGRSYVYAVKIKNKPPEGMFYGARLHEHSLRTYPNGEDKIVFIGGQGHTPTDVDESDKRYSSLIKYARERFDIESYEYRWSTEDCITVDRVPYIGRLNPSSKHLYVTTGFNAWGMTTSMVSANILSDMILNRPNPWTSFFDPSRPVSKSVTEIISQNIEVVKNYVKGHFLPQKEDNISSLQNGQGKVFTIKGQKAAVYKDSKGNVHAVSAVCTHMGCIVGWNKGDQSWDCPCHGSRFAKDGSVIKGPAIRNLEKKELNNTKE